MLMTVCGWSGLSHVRILRKLWDNREGIIEKGLVFINRNKILLTNRDTEKDKQRETVKKRRAEKNRRKETD